MKAGDQAGHSGHYTSSYEAPWCKVVEFCLLYSNPGIVHGGYFEAEIVLKH